MLRRSLVLCALSACTSSDPVCEEVDRYVVPVGAEDLTFHIGPYLEHTTETSAAIGWESVNAGSTELRYWLPDEEEPVVVKGDSGTMHQVQLTGLEPRTRYRYRACSDGSCTGDLHFATAPGPVGPTRFAVYGDCQAGPDQHEKVVEQVIADEASMVIVVGDTVSDGQIREQFKERYYDPARKLAHSIPRYAAVGNHDRKDVQAVHWRDYHIYPEDRDVPQPETSYTFTYGDAFFLVLDNTLDRLDLFFSPAEGVEPPPLLTWLQKQAASPAAQNAKWRFAFAHYPPDTDCREEGTDYGLPEVAVRGSLLPLLWEHNFQAYFAGHVHCYERFDFDGHLVITTGGGGGGLEEPGRCGDGLPEARIHHCVHHHVTVELGCDEARLWARDNEGRVFEEVVLQEDGGYEVTSTSTVS